MLAHLVPGRITPAITYRVKALLGCLEHLEKAVQHYLDGLDGADREPALVPEARVSQLKEKIAAIRSEMRASSP